MIIHWQDEIELVKSIVKKTELQHAIKWGIDVYTLNGKNIIGIAPFKSYLGIWFYNGVFLSDKLNIFVNVQEGKTKALRQWRFQSLDEIHEEAILSYLKESIDFEKAGKRWVAEKSEKINIPSILCEALSSNAELSFCFKKLSPYKQKEYVNYIQEAKREATQITRMKKIKPMIMNGIGLNDKYK